MTLESDVRPRSGTPPSGALPRLLPRRPARVDGLVVALAVAAGTASVAGLVGEGGPGRHVATTARGVAVTLYGEGVYRADSLLVGAGNRGQDVVILGFEIAALLGALRWHRRGSVTGSVVLAGVLAFFAYCYTSMTFAAAQNRLFPLYVIAMATAAGALVMVLAQVVPRAEELRLPARPGRPALLAYLAGVALALTAAWLPGMLAVSLSGDIGRHVGPYTSAATEALDLGIVVPVVVLAAVQLYRDRPVGRLLTLLVLVLNVCIGVLLMGQGLAQLLLDVPLTTAEIVAKMGSFAVLTLVAGALLLRAALAHRASRQEEPSHA